VKKKIPVRGDYKEQFATTRLEVAEPANAGGERWGEKVSHAQALR